VATGLSTVACLLGTAATVANAAPVVRAARVHAVLTSPTACDVEAAYTIQADQPAPIRFTLQTFDGTQVELSAVNGAGVAASQVQPTGKTTVFSTQLTGGSQTTTLRYHVTQASEWAYRCPIWLPAIPTDGRPGAVSLQVEWPSGATLTGATLPPLRQTQTGGSSSLANIPAFVRVPYSAAGDPHPASSWDVTRVMDAATIAVLLGSSVLWLVVRERRRRRAPVVARGN